MNSESVSEQQQAKELTDISSQACRLKNNLIRYRRKYEPKNDDPKVWRRHKRNFECDTCGYKFYSTVTLRLHKLAHEGKQPFNCNLCSFSTSVKKNLGEHVEKHKYLKLLTCDLCEYSCISPRALLNHTRTHGVEKPFECGMCGYATDSFGSLEEHSRTHTKERPYMCSICGSSFSRNSDLRDHSFSHTGLDRGKEIQQCTLCGFQTMKRNTLVKHIRTHTAEKYYQCKFCQREFRWYSSLFYHLRTHTGEKPHKCEICGFATSHPSSRRRHMERAHKITTRTARKYLDRAKEVARRHTVIDNRESPAVSMPIQRNRREAKDVEGVSKGSGLKDGSVPAAKPWSKEGGNQNAQNHQASLAPRSISPRSGSSNTNPSGSPRISRQPQVCDYCGRRVGSVLKLIDHLRLHTGQKLYKCDRKDCCFKTGNEALFNLHKKSHALLVP